MTIFWERCRAEGYADAVAGRSNRRLAYPPEGRSFYDAGRKDGAFAKHIPDVLEALRGLMGYVGGWDLPDDHPCGKAAAVLSCIDGGDK